MHSLHSPPERCPSTWCLQRSPGVFGSGKRQLNMECLDIPDAWLKLDLMWFDVVWFNCSHANMQQSSLYQASSPVQCCKLQKPPPPWPSLCRCLLLDERSDSDTYFDCWGVLQALWDIRKQKNVWTLVHDNYGKTENPKIIFIPMTMRFGEGQFSDTPILYNILQQRKIKVGTTHRATMACLLATCLAVL